MASYPSRLLEDAKHPFQIAVMNHYCYLSKFKSMKNYIGSDAWNALKDSSVGVFLKLVDMDLKEKYIWSSHIVHFFLSHQLGVNNIHELWSLIDGQPLRFSLHEFKEITCLNCDPFTSDNSSENGDGDADYQKFWKEMEVPLRDRPTWVELLKVLKSCQSWSKEKRIMLRRLCILHVGIYDINHGSRIPLCSARRVFDAESFERYPWGREGFTSLVNSIKVLQYTGDSYQLHGCVHVLLIWLFEYVPVLGELYGFRRGIPDVPPLLNWRGCHQRFSFKDLIKYEKAKHGKVRVRHMLPVALEDMYPQWSDKDNKLDSKLDKLIEDIIGDCLVENAWSVERKVLKKRVPHADLKSSKSVVMSDLSQTSKKKKKKKIKGKGHSNDHEDSKFTIAGMMKVMETFTHKLGELDNKFDTRMHFFYSTG